MQVATTAPGLQVYDGAGLPRPRAGVALECQHWPDAVHHPHFPDTILRPGALWQSITRYRFQKGSA